MADRRNGNPAKKLAAAEQRLPLEDVIGELVRPIVHRQDYQEAVETGGLIMMNTAVHVTTHPGLIQQLRLATATGSGSSDGARAGYTSKPTARIDAIDTLIWIDQQATSWQHRLGRTVNVPTPTETIIQSLHAPARDDTILEDAIRGWRSRARLLSGWDQPPFQPNNTCPACRKRGGLRVRVDPEREAMCVDCKASWDAVTIGVLVVHIRAENQEDTLVGTGS